MRVLIADDEDLVRERFKKAFPMRSDGFVLVGEADNGEEALKLCRDLKPDIVITDIVMPGMDGLRLLQALKLEMISIKVIILSCHREFDYARKAMSLGALDYILKVKARYPQILNALQRARVEIEADRRNIQEQIKLRQQFVKNYFALRENAVNNLITGVYRRPNELRTFMDAFHVEDDQSWTCFSVGILEIEYSTNLIRNYTPSDIELFRYGCMKLLEEVEIGPRKVKSFSWKETQIGLWLYGSNSTRNFEADIKRYVTLVEGHVRSYFPYTVSIGLSAVHVAQLWSVFGDRFKDALTEAKQSLEWKFYQSDTNVFEWKQWGGRSMLSLSHLRERTIREKLETMNFDANGPQLDEWFESEVVPLLLYLRPKDMCTLIAKLAEDVTVPKSSEDSGGVLKPKYETFVEAMAGLRDYVRLRSNRQNIAGQVNEVSDHVHKAIEHMHAHYHEIVSVSVVSGKICVSPNYLSHIFKKEIGLSFTDYLMRLRTAKAKELLTLTSLKVEVIAERVGFQDVKYFSRMFRRMTGITPSQFRTNGK